MPEKEENPFRDASDDVLDLLIVGLSVLDLRPPPSLVGLFMLKQSQIWAVEEKARRLGEDGCFVGSDAD